MANRGRSVIYAVMLVFFPFALVAGGTGGRLQDIFVGPIYETGPADAAVLVESPQRVDAVAAANFKLLADGLEVAAGFKKSSFSQSGERLAWAIGVDTSVRMAPSLLNQAKETLKTFLPKMRHVRTEIAALGAEPEIIKSFEESDGRGVFSKALDNLKTNRPGGAARLDESIAAALAGYELTTETLPKRRRILMIWGGKDQTSSDSLTTVVGKANAMGVRVDTIALGAIEREFRDILHGVSDRTGGRFVSALPGAVTLNDALTLIHTEVMETHAVLVYFKYAPGAVAGKTLAIELRQPNAPTLSRTLPATTPSPDAANGDLGGDVPAVAAGVRDDAATPRARSKQMWLKWLYWLLAAFVVVFVCVGVVIAGRRISEKIARSGEPKQVSPGRVEPVLSPADTTPETTAREKPPEPQRRTRVGASFPPPAPHHPAAILVALEGVMQHRQIGIDKAIFRIGADSHNDLSISRDDYVSGTHALLRYDKGSLFILDQGSRNGTIVNGQRLSGTARLLAVGDRIKIGASLFEVRLPPKR